jgi:hypothetical protein
MTDIARKEPSNAKKSLQTRETPSQQSSGFRWSVLLIEIPVGILFFLFNFDGFMRFVARNYVVNINQSLAEWIIGFSYLPRQFYAMLSQTESDLFLSLFRLALYGIGTYFVLILLLSFREKHSRMFFYSLGGLTIGFLNVPILAWTIFLIFALVIFLLAIINFILPILIYIGLVLLGIWLVVLTIQFLWERYKWGTVITAVLTATFAYLWGKPVFLFLLTNILWPIFSALIATISFIVQILGAVLGFLARILEPLIKVLLIFIQILGAVLGFLARILEVLLIFIAGMFIFITGIGIIALLGRLLIDQYKAAWESGSGSKGVLAGSFSVGLALGLIFLNCYGHSDQMSTIDRAWAEVVTFANWISPMNVFEFLIPPSYSEAISLIFSSLSYPLFDSFVLVTVLALSWIGIIRGMFSTLRDEFRVTFVSKEALGLVVAVPMGVFLLLLQAIAPKED